MAYLYLDESGCLGFDFSKAKTSKFFVITILFSDDRKGFEKIIKKVYGELAKRAKIKSGSLHCHKEKPITRQRVLRMVAQKNCAIMAIYLNKKKVYTHLQDEKQVLYNYVTNILLDRIYTKKIIPTAGPVVLIASKRETNKFLNENFVRYLNGQSGSHHSINLKVEIKTHNEDKVLQVVDFISWAIFRKYEHQDESYREFIKAKIVEENALFS